LIGSHQSQRSRYGDLIPWTLLQQFGEQEFSQMSGVRVVRVATHPAYQRVSYFNSNKTNIKMTGLFSQCHEMLLCKFQPVQTL